MVACAPPRDTPDDKSLPARDDPAPAAVEASYVGSENCAECHAQEAELWRGSHHDLAMQEARPSTVLGDFENVSYRRGGVTATFSRRDDRLHVRTQGDDGEVHEYEIAYTFGVDPLQQYLVPLPGGRLQAFRLAWDARPAERGGQRWFDLYADAEIEPGDPLHWTGRDQNWNFMCAECHSTHLRKGYDPDTDSYRTTWAELDVACEACHGPGSEHVAWAATGQDGGGPAHLGLTVRLRDAEEAEWTMDPATGIARRGRQRASRAQLHVCSRCHARRSVLSEEYRHGEPLLDTHRPSLLEEGLYFPDGQIRDEVYVWGSFLQSRMYHQGVTCSDCHDPHSLAVRGEGNGQCSGCHLPERFDTVEHHHHPPGSAGALCVECHMPPRTYMLIDRRRDHSFRVPRPELSLELGSPDPCASCHADRDASWAAARLAEWRGSRPSGTNGHFGEVLQAAREGRPEARFGLAALLADGAQPGIVRATAALHLGGLADRDGLAVLAQALDDSDPLVRLGALGGLEPVAPRTRWELAFPRLRDPLLAVRVEAARLLAGTPRELLTRADRDALDAAIGEYRRTQLVNAERPEAWMNLGVLNLSLGRLDEAERAYGKALLLDPGFVPALINLADLRRLQARDDEGEVLLRRAVSERPESAEARHALGLLLVRQDRLAEAVAELRRAAELAPDNERYGEVYALARQRARLLDSTQRP